MYMTHEKFEERRQLLIRNCRRKDDMQPFLEFRAKRYALFRVQNMLSGGSMAEPEHMELVKHYQESDKVSELGGIEQFCKTWDIDPLSNEICARDDIWKKHDEKVIENAEELPIGG